MSGSFFSHCGTTLLNEMASGKHFTDLPDELLIKIFSHISMEDLTMSVQHVSSHWKHVSQDDALWKDKVFGPGRDMDDEEIARRLKNMPSLKAFCPKRGMNIRNIVKILCRYCKDIQHLELRFQTLSSITLRNIVETFPNIVNLMFQFPKEPHDQLEIAKLVGQFQNLTTLTLLGINTLAEGILLAIADGCCSLQDLSTGPCVFPESEIRYLFKKRGHQLVSLSLGCYISTLGHELLCECTNLKYLNYEHYNDDLPATYMNHLSRLLKLEELTLSYFYGDQSRNIPEIFHKQSLPNLVKLSLFFCDDLGEPELIGIFTHCLQILSFYMRGYNDPGDSFKYIFNLKQLEHLDICGIHLLDKSVGYISAGCENLKHLYVGSCSELTDMSAKYIGDGCKHLISLDVACCPKLTDSSVEYVCTGCPKLKFLDISDCPLMTEAMIQSAVKCKTLTVLHTKFNSISGNYFQLIPSNLICLKELDIFGCEKVDFENVLKLQEAMPGLKIVVNHKKNDNEEWEIFLEDSNFFTTLYV
ncbi:F-box and leucine-rich repeat protein 13-like isoform X3 [Periplaneta americana]|uniref:F-box and leucine-rich repeat protein 13-like isoform X3 n=1 Tax=Periplaneta americana TaxID=6978 RepID=UPI0037E71A16